MNFKKTATLILVLISYAMFAQVGVNTTTPEGALDVTSTSNGFIPPRVTLNATNIAAPVVNPQGGALSVGTIVWNTNTAGTAPNNVVPGLYVWNGTIWVLVNYSDGDFHEVGTSSPPDAITDDVFRTGNVAIGKTTAASALDVQDNTSTNSASIASTGSDNVLYVRRSGSKSGTSRGIYVDYVNSDSGSDTRQAISTFVRGGAGTGTRYGVYNNVQSASGGTNQTIGTYNQLTSGNGTGEHMGVYNRLSGNTDRTKTGVSTYLTGSDNGTHYGINNNIASTGTGTHTGVQNQMRGSGTVRGVYNTFGNNAGNGTNRGFENQMTNDGSGTHQGVYNSLSGDGTGEHTGVSNFITGTGNGVKNGIANTISSGTGTGIHRGVYNNISGSGTIYGVENDIDGTLSGQTAYGTFNDVNSDNGTNIAGWFDAHGTGATYFAAVFNRGDVVANEASGDYDFRIEGQTDNDLFFADASTDRVGIGTNAPAYKLDVVGDINTSGDLRNSGVINTPDYVFETYFDGFSKFDKTYKMMSLEDLESFLKTNKHLPNIQSRADVKENGWNITEGVRDNLEKVEELFLHAIEASKKVNALEKENETLKNKLNQALKLLSILNDKINALEKQ